MLNWLDRYAAVVAALEFEPGGDVTESVLDVGCGPHGLSVAAPAARFVGIDLMFPDTVARGMIALRNQPGPLPFADAAFDTVICLDVLEHVPGPARQGFVRELARVAARRVFLACPSDEAAWIDGLVRDAFVTRGTAVPSWLSEHDEYGLPSGAEIAAHAAVGAEYTCRPLPMTNGLLSALTALADMLPELQVQAQAEFADHREAWLRTFMGSRFGPSHRHGYVIERVERRPALVRSVDLDTTVWASLHCPGCGQVDVLTRVDTDVRCQRCGHLLRTEPSGARSLAPPPAPRVRAPIRTSAARRLLFAPDWRELAGWVPAVVRFVASGRTGETALCLDAVDCELGVDVVAQMVARVCEAAGAGRPFDDVVILDQPYDAAGTEAVDGGPALARALDLRAPEVPRDPEQCLARALRAKELLDGLQAVIDRRRFELTPDPLSDPEPLVSVRIPTWRGHDLLTRRTIPSVLTGTYANVEVVVCSDGPDPVARAAVEGLADPRVRYLELAERPAYPAAPWSFWQVAGIHAIHHALDHCRGAFIAPLDHDDAFSQDHVSTLLETARRQQADFVYGQAMMEMPDGAWWVCGSEPLAHGHIVHGSVLYSRRLAHVRLDPHAWLLDEPGDWNMWRRMREMGARTAFVDRVVTVHFGERTSIDAAGAEADIEALRDRTAAESVADLERTGLLWLAELELGPASAG